MNIPKIIHYCWFGEKEIPQKEKECIASWQEFFPDFEFRFWTDKNFDYESCLYAKQAYSMKKYAFVSDYARAKLLYEQGGIYLDTDVRVIRKFPDVSAENGFMGFERKAFLGTAVMASVPGNPALGELLRYYEEHSFVQQNGLVDNIANVSIITDIMKNYGLILGGGRQKAAGFEIFNREVFYPKKLGESQFQVTEETCAVHMCSNSWLTERERKRGNSKIWIELIRPALRSLRAAGIKLAGKENMRSLEIRLRNWLR